MRRTTTRISRRSPGRARGSRAAILAAAGNIFARSGLAGARTDAIAADAGVNKALLYYYFRSKEELYEAVVEDHFREFNRRALEVLDGPGPARDVLLNYVGLHLDFIGERHHSAPLFHQLTMTGGKFLKRLVERYFNARSQALDRVIERGIRNGEFRRVDRFQAAISIVSLIVFYFSSARILKLMGHHDAYSANNLRQHKQEVLDFIRHGLFSDSKKPTL